MENVLLLLEVPGRTHRPRLARHANRHAPSRAKTLFALTATALVAEALANAQRKKRRESRGFPLVTLERNGQENPGAAGSQTVSLSL